MTTITEVTFDPLVKRASTGKIQIWEIRVVPEDNGAGTIVITHGQVDGKKQEKRETITQGKNVGKKNETTPFAQAVAEARGRWNKQRDRKHYGLTVEESEAKRAAAPMLAQEYSQHGQKVDWAAPVYVQPKFNGHRCLIFRTDDGALMFSRGGELIETCPHIAEDIAAVMPVGSVLDGELYLHGEPLNKIGSYIRRAQAKSAELKFMSYDYANPELSFRDRFRTLQSVADKLARNDNIIVTDTQRVRQEESARELEAQWVEMGYEGAMIRWGVTGYEPGKRSYSLLKMKSFEDTEFTVVGAKEGSDGIAVFSCLTKDGNPFDVTAPGTMPEKKQMWIDREQYIGKSLTVKHQGYTATDNPVPFIPVAKGFRD